MEKLAIHAATTLVLAGVCLWLYRREKSLSLPNWAFWLGLILFGVSYTGLSLLRLASGAATAYDLGNTEHLIYLISKGHLAGMAVGHLRPSLVLFAPFYKILPHPATLLILQGIVLTAGGLVARSLARLYSDEAGGNLLGLMFFLYPGLGWAWLFDFHPDCLLPLAVLAAFWFFKSKKMWAFVIAALSVALIKESFALLTLGLGVFALVKRRFLAGSLLVLAGGLWFWFASKVVLVNYHYAKAFGFSMGFFPEKLTYIISVLGPFLALPVIAPEFVPGWISLAASLSSSLPNYFTYKYHYALTLLPFLIAGSGWFMARLGPKKSKRLGLGLLISALAFHLFQAPSVLSWEFWFRARSNHHISAYLLKPDPVRELVNQIPANASVSYQNQLFRPGIASRDSLFVFASGLGLADYILIDTTGPFWVKVQDARGVVVDSVEFWKYTHRALEDYQVVESRGSVLLLKRSGRP